MKWLKTSVAILLLVLAALAAYLGSTAFRSTNPVGFQVQRVDSASGPLAVALWYPTIGRPMPTTFVGGTLLSVVRDGPVYGEALPLVVLSHGNNGSALSHVDLAMALANAGYIVVAPTHAGDNFADPSRQSSPSLFNQRAEQLSATLSYALEQWAGKPHIDRDRIGAYGMSAGAFTVLTLAGAQPDMTRIPAHCAAHPEFICTVLEHTQSPLLTDASRVSPFEADPRIKAASIAAPGLGFTLADGLSDVRIPVQLWWGSEDDTVPYASNAGVVATGLGRRAEVHVLEGARHLSFLAPCRLLKPATACTDAAEFDREAAHTRMNAEVIAFFDRTLRGEAHDLASLSLGAR